MNWKGGISKDPDYLKKYLSKWNYKDGKTCKSCGKPITNPSTYCKKCHLKGENHPFKKKEGYLYISQTILCLIKEDIYIVPGIFYLKN